MSGAATNSAISRFLDRRGQSVTLRNYEDTGGDDYGPNWSETSGSPYSVQMKVDAPGDAPEAIRDAFGQDIEETRAFYLETGTTAESEVSGGAGDGASEMDFDGETWVVLSKTTQDSDLTRLITTRGA